jgi:hypothetical protein
MDSARAETVRKVSSIVGAAGGAGVAFLSTVYWGVLAPDSMFKAGSDPWLVAADIVPSFAVFSAVTWAATRGFTEAFLRLRIGKWWSVPAGIAFGAVGGAAVGAVGFTTMMGIGHPMNIIATGDISWPRCIGLSVLAGGLWGGLSGVIPGAVMGPVISFSMDF